MRRDPYPLEMGFFTIAPEHLAYSVLGKFLSLSVHKEKVLAHDFSSPLAVFPQSSFEFGAKRYLPFLSALAIHQKEVLIPVDVLSPQAGKLGKPHAGVQKSGQDGIISQSQKGLLVGLRKKSLKLGLSKGLHYFFLLTGRLLFFEGAFSYIALLLQKAKEDFKHGEVVF
ncbi:MAG: hypothetical protein DDT18_01524 [Actinobacteria bacterium]|nr:hypothetical protein [Actinomycetota bacterium]